MSEQESDQNRAMFQLSKTEDYGKKTRRSIDQNAQLLSQKRKDRDSSIGERQR